MFRVTDLYKSFGEGKRAVHAVSGVSFSVRTGTLAAVVGKSGSGKSTLLALLGALETPTSGTIELAGTVVTKLSGRRLLAYRRTTVGFVFQNYNLIPNLSAFDNVLLPLEFAGVSRTERHVRAAHLLEHVGLSGDILKRHPGKLSGGEQQRVAIARALVNKPKLILADEPTGNLDTSTSRTIIDLLRNLARSEKTTIIAVTHDQAIANHADAVFHLADGKLI